MVASILSACGGLSTRGPQGAATPASAVQRYLSDVWIGRYAEAMALARNRDGTPITGTAAILDTWWFESNFGAGHPVPASAIRARSTGQALPQPGSDVNKPPSVGVDVTVPRAMVPFACGADKRPPGRENMHIGAASVRVRGRWYVTAAPAFSLITPCSSDAQVYAHEAHIRRVEAELPFFPMFPPYLPGMPAIAGVGVTFDARSAIGPCRQATLTIRYTSGGSTVLTLHESNGLLAKPIGLRGTPIAPTSPRPNVPVPPPPTHNGRPIDITPTGTAYVKRTAGGALNEYWAKIPGMGMEVQLDSMHFTGEQLAAVAAEITQLTPPQAGQRSCTLLPLP